MRTDYHLEELQIALSPTDPRHISPQIPFSCRSIVDIGCGAGQTLIGLKLPSTSLIIGVDCDLKALTLGKQLAPDIHFVCAKGEALPFVDGCFDFALSRLALFYMNISIAVDEAARVLNEGGRLWCVLRNKTIALRNLHITMRNRNARAFLFELYSLVNGLIFHVVGRMAPCPFSDGRYASFQTEFRIKRLLRNCGFSEVKVHGRGHLIVFATRKHRLIRSGGIKNTESHV